MPGGMFLSFKKFVWGVLDLSPLGPDPTGGLRGRGLSLAAPARRVVLRCTIGVLPVRPGHAGSACAQGSVLSRRVTIAPQYYRAALLFF